MSEMPIATLCVLSLLIVGRSKTTSGPNPSRVTPADEKDVNLYIWPGLARPGRSAASEQSPRIH